VVALEQDRGEMEKMGNFSWAWLFSSAPGDQERSSWLLEGHIMDGQFAPIPHLNCEFALSEIMEDLTELLSPIALLQISSLVQFLTENCCRIFGEEITSLFGEMLITCKRENGSGNTGYVLTRLDS